MTYSVSFPCDDCRLKDKCTDRHFIEGAVYGIHSVFPMVKGHLGAGEIELICSNIQPKEVAPPEAPEDRTMPG